MASVESVTVDAAEVDEIVLLLGQQLHGERTQIGRSRS
jgi:hypothetical protein